MKRPSVVYWCGLALVGMALLVTTPSLASGQSRSSMQLARDSLDVNVLIETGLTRTYAWNLAYSVTPNTQSAYIGEEALAEYTLTASRSAQDSNWLVLGRIQVTNHKPGRVRILAVHDEVGGQPVAVQCSRSLPVLLKAGETLTCQFTRSLPDANDRLNTTWVDLPGNPNDAIVTTPVTFTNATIHPVNATIHVLDPSGLAGPWSFTQPGSVSYLATYTCNEGDWGPVSETRSATIQETGQTASVDFTLFCQSPDISDFGNGAYTATHYWSINKTVDQPEVSLALGEVTTVNYMIDINREWVVSDFGGRSTLMVSNPAYWQSPPLFLKVQQVNVGVSANSLSPAQCTLSFPATLPPDSGFECNFASPLPGAVEPVLWEIKIERFRHMPDGSLVSMGIETILEQSYLAFDFIPWFTDNDITEINDGIHIWDSYAGDLVTTGGKYLYIPEYAREIGPYDTCGDYVVENTAEFSAETSGYNNNNPFFNTGVPPEPPPGLSTSGSDSQSVVVHVSCEP